MTAFHLQARSVRSGDSLTSEQQLRRCNFYDANELGTYFKTQDASYRFETLSEPESD